MARQVARAESWERVHTAFEQVNFTAFDYDTIKSSLIEYIKTYYPEQFNDYIESSEIIMIIEIFAYVGELLSYRVDLAAHENFISTAQRKESVLRLAKLISYSASRNIPARGLVKITSVSTTETIFDSAGNNLINRKIIWNDQNNTNWKEQFFLVMNKVLEQEFGSVLPNDRKQVDNVLFELYSVRNESFATGVIGYSSSVSGKSILMELVPTALTDSGPEEKRPENNSKFTILYGSDGLGDSSDTTGFFIFTKQGELQKFSTTFDGVTPNQTYEVEVSNINQTDVWVNNINPSTLEILDDGSSETGRSGEWGEVDVSSSQNIIFNTSTNRNKFEIETLENDKVKIIFGDGNFAAIPSGSFDIWVRVSSSDDVIIPQRAVIEKDASFSYKDIDGNSQTLSFSFSLISSLQNASPSEDIEHIRRIAPSVFYTQDRMVNGQDYNTFLLRDPTILKLRAINRTFAGDPKFIDFNDPSQTYQNVKIFGEDLILYYKNVEKSITLNESFNGRQLVNNYIEPLLSSTDVLIKMALLGVLEPRTRFDDTLPLPNEKSDIEDAIDSTITTLILKYDVNLDLWNFSTGEDMIIIDPIKQGTLIIGWIITYMATSLIAESETTKFWNSNDGSEIINYDSLTSDVDKITVLRANLDKNRTNVLTQNLYLDVLAHEVYETGLSNAGLPNINQLQVITANADFDAYPDNLNLSNFFDPEEIDLNVTVPYTHTLANSYIVGQGDVSVYADNGGGYVLMTEGVDWIEVGAVNSVSYAVQILNTGAINTGDDVKIIVKDYVYFSRPSIKDDWNHIAGIDANKLLFIASDGTLFKRERGRDNLNFMWFHRTPNFNLIDPSVTNIIDIFLITRGYYTNIKNWLNGLVDEEPDAPTPLQLRTDYKSLLDNKMISDTVVLHPGKFKILFGEHAPDELKAQLKVIRSSSANNSFTDNQIKLKVVNAVRDFFDINSTEFGQSFHFTSLAAYIHNRLPSEIDSVVLVPTYAENHFGDLFQVYAREDEIIQPSININNVEIIENLTSSNIRQIN